VILSGNQALDPAGFAPALVTATQKKVMLLDRKNFARRQGFITNAANIGRILIAQERQVHTYLRCLPGLIDRIPLSIRA